METSQSLLLRPCHKLTSGTDPATELHVEAKSCAADLHQTRL